MKELSDGAYRNEFYVAHISKPSASLYAIRILLRIPRHPWGGQRRSPYRNSSCVLLVKKANTGLGPALHTRQRGNDRGHRDSVRSQGREGTRQVRLHSGQVITELVLWTDCGGREVLQCEEADGLSILHSFTDF